jgi:hypothetical protein
MYFSLKFYVEQRIAIHFVCNSTGVCHAVFSFEDKEERKLPPNAFYLLSTHSCHHCLLSLDPPSIAVEEVMSQIQPTVAQKCLPLIRCLHGFGPSGGRS